MELYIDNKRADIDRRTAVSLTLSVAVATDPRKGRAGYTRELRLPATPANREIFGYAGEIHARERFNADEHSARLECGGAVLIEGPLYLSACRRGAEGGSYTVYIIGASKEWAQRAAGRALRSTALDYSATITGQTIMQSWTADTPVRFLPVLRERNEADHSSGGVIPAMKVLSADDYHPFIHADTLLRAIFAESGYTVVSDFADGELFRSLYISGNYHSRDVSALKANMDFLARRLRTSTAQANSLGRVYADPYRDSFSVGNIVDTADPAYSLDGVSAPDAFSNNGCFQMDDDRVMFLPTGEVSVGFRYHLRYTTDYRIKNRRQLAGFDRVYLGEQSPRQFTLANPYPDRRQGMRPARSYKLAVFGHTAGREYQLRYTQQTQTEVKVVSLPAVAARFSEVAVAAALTVGNPQLYYRESAAGEWALYADDRALYDGFVGETGTLDVELTLRSAPETVSPSRPKFFDGIWFGGADAGMKITVGDAVRIRPVFHAQPTEGSAVGFADIAVHDASQMDFIDSLRQMFNLCFQTDNRARTVRIEPRPDFYSDSETIDWTGRIDLSKPLTVEEPGADLAREMVWSYRSGDGAVARFNRASGERMGRWSAAVDNRAAQAAVSEWQNPMFTPSLNAEGGYRGAVSASLVQAGDLSAEQPERTENLDFAPKIVRYEGMKTLPENESWGWPSGGASYPKLSFHDPDQGFTLCFEDRDGAAGLHSRYDRDVRLWNLSRRVTLWLRLEPADIESLSFPTGHGADFRKLYRLDIDGETALYRLEEVCGYSPAAPSTKCVFIKHIP